MMQSVTYPGLGHLDRPMGPAPLSAAVLNGPLLFISGQVGIDPMTRQVAGSDVSSQTRQALKNIQSLVHAAGMTMATVVKVGIFLVDPDDFAAMNEVYATFFAPPFPARATVGIRLNDPSLLIELDAIAMREA